MKDRIAGIVPFTNNNTTRRIKHKYSYNYSYDCLAQCMYALRYVNYKNALLLQKISHHNYGIDYNDVVKLLNMAYPSMSYHWDLIDRTYYRLNNDGTYLDEDFYHILEMNQATLCFLESSKNDVISHYVIVYRKGFSIMIRDPQMNYTGYLNDYMSYDPDLYSNLYILFNLQYKITQDNGVKREHICELFGCENFEHIDKLYKKTYKKDEKTKRKLMSHLNSNNALWNYNSIWN